MRSPEDLTYRIQIINQGADDERIDRSQNAQLIKQPFRFAAKFMEIFRRWFGFRTGQRITGRFVSALHGAANIFAIEVFDRPPFDLFLQLLQLRRRLLLPVRKCCHEMFQFRQKQLLCFAECLLRSAPGDFL